MNRYQFLTALLEKSEQFEKSMAEQSNFSIHEFANYLIGNDLNHFTSERLNNDESSSSRDERLGLETTPTDIEQTIGQNIVFLYRYAKQYTKKGLKNSELKTIDEFTYLATLLNFESLSKIELITKSVQEKTTGMETIKRLLKNDLMEQFDNPKDQRSQLLRLTEHGKSVLFSVFQNMSLVGKVIGGNLTSTEKNQLAYLLQKLDTHHNDIFLNKKNCELSELVF